MLRFVLADLLFIGFIAIMLYLIWRHREYKRTHRIEAYFSGGLLHGETRELEGSPRVITFNDEIYRRDDALSDATAPMYMYAGEVTDKNTFTSYELKA